MDSYRDKGRKVDCYSGIVSSTITFVGPRAGFTAITLINIHFHHMPAKRHRGCSSHYHAFWDNVRQLMPPQGPAILAGDFNMACFEVVPELQRRQLFVLPILLPPRPPAGGALEDCMAMFALWHAPDPGQPDPSLPYQVRIQPMHDFDPDRLLLGHGSHHATTAYFTYPSAPRVRSEAGAQRHRDRKLQNKAYRHWKAEGKWQVPQPTTKPVRHHWTTTSKHPPSAAFVAEVSHSGASSSSGPYLPPTNKSPQLRPRPPPPPPAPTAPAPAGLSSAPPPPPPPPPLPPPATTPVKAVLTPSRWPRPVVQLLPRPGLTLTPARPAPQPWPAAGVPMPLPPPPPSRHPPHPGPFQHLPEPPQPPLPDTVLYPAPQQPEQPAAVQVDLTSQQPAVVQVDTSSYYSTSRSRSPSQAATVRCGKRTTRAPTDAQAASVAGSSAKAASSGAAATHNVDLEPEDDSIDGNTDNDDL